MTTWRLRIIGWACSKQRSNVVFQIICGEDGCRDTQRVEDWKIKFQYTYEPKYTLNANKTDWFFNLYQIQLQFIEIDSILEENSREHPSSLMYCDMMW